MGSDYREKIPWKSDPIDKDKLKCSHCGKMTHMKESCWDFVGRPKNFNKPRSIRANSVSSYVNNMSIGYAPQKVVGTDTAPSGEVPS